jgi:hypothetical protein
MDSTRLKYFEAVKNWSGIAIRCHSGSFYQGEIAKRYAGSRNRFEYQQRGWVGDRVGELSHACSSEKEGAFWFEAGALPGKMRALAGADVL